MKEVGDNRDLLIVFITFGLC